MTAHEGCAIEALLPPPALVLLFAGTRSPLWDAAVHGVVDQIENTLERVIVSCAVAAGRGPTLADALAAVRFLGCGEIAVMATPELDEVAVARCLSTAGVAAEGCELLACELEAGAIAERFHQWTRIDTAQAA